VSKIGVSQHSLASAAVVVPLVLDHVVAARIIDFGCKHGEWLSVFQKFGVSDVEGLDCLDRMELLLVDRGNFRRVDFRQPFEILERFDLAVCLEVAEHLPPATGEPLVATLTRVAPVVLFSAAVCLQGGNEHLNERPRDYWKQLFARHGFTRIDCLRPLIWQDARVAWWYRQNMFFFASAEGLALHPRLRDAANRPTADDLDLLHRDVLYQRSTVSGWVRHLAVRGRQAFERVLRERSRTS
jgi:methyltransferase family protein